MRKKRIFIVLFIVTCCFILTGCGSKNKESYIQVDQVNEKKVHVEVNNLKKGEEKSATLEVGEGEDIFISYNMEGFKGLIAEGFLIKDGKRKSIGTDLIIGEDGESTISEIEAGTYEFVFTADQDGVTGVLNITAKTNEN